MSLHVLWCNALADSWSFTRFEYERNPEKYWKILSCYLKKKEINLLTFLPLSLSLTWNDAFSCRTFSFVPCQRSCFKAWKDWESGRWTFITFSGWAIQKNRNKFTSIGSNILARISQNFVRKIRNILEIFRWFYKAIILRKLVSYDFYST